MTSAIESGFVGFVLGFLLGIFLIIIIAGYILITAMDYSVPSTGDTILGTALTYYNAHSGVFGLAFLFGFFTGIGSTKAIHQLI